MLERFNYDEIIILNAFCEASKEITLVQLNASLEHTEDEAAQELLKNVCGKIEAMSIIEYANLFQKLPVINFFE